MAGFRPEQMRNEPTFRQMELKPHMSDGEIHSPENVRLQAEQARQQAEFYEAQRVQWETQRRELEQSNEQKALFNDGLNELGMKIHNAVRRMERELESMDREQRELEQVCSCFKSHLQVLSALQPQHWNTEGFKERLRDAVLKLDRAENDFNEAYALKNKFQHTDIFKHKPGEEPNERLSWRLIREHMLKGLAFHLPLFLLLLITWLIYLAIIHN